MIYWFFGNSGAGKTTHAKESMWKGQEVLLDGDEMRDTISRDLGFSAGDRWVQGFRVARLAKLLDSQLDQAYVFVALITPYRKLRKRITELVGEENIRWFYVPGGREPSKEFPFEPPLEDENVTIVKKT